MAASDIAKLSFKDKESNVQRIVEYFNFLLKDDLACVKMLPVSATDKADLPKKCADGVLLCRFFKLQKPKLFEDNQLNTGEKKTGFQINTNQLLVIQCLKDLGYRGYEKLMPEDIANAKFEMLVEIIEKVIKTLLFADLSPSKFPDLVAIAPLTNKGVANPTGPAPAAAPADPMAKVQRSKRAPIEPLMIRFLNQQLRCARYGKAIKGFADMNPEAWAHVAHSLCPQKAPLAPMLNEHDAQKKAELIANNLKLAYPAPFITATEIMETNETMFTYYLATLLPKCPVFNTYFTKIAEAAMAGDPKEEALKLYWLCSGKEPVEKFLEKLKDHVFIFEIMDLALPGKVDWKLVNKGKLNNFKAQDNWKYAMKLTFAATRFPPSIEVGDLVAGKIDKIMQLVDVLVAAEWESKWTSQAKESDLVAWGNGWADKAGVPAIQSLAEAKTNWIAAILHGIDRTSNFFFDMSKLGADEEANAKEIMLACWKFGVWTYVTAHQIASGDKKAIQILLMNMKRVMDLIE